MSAPPEPDYHLTGWFNLLVPGGGQFLLGEYGRAGVEAGIEVGAGYTGFSLSKRSPMTLDGVPEALPVFQGRRKRAGSLVSIDTAVYADLLQEVGIKAHLVDVFTSYREAARRRGVTDHIDQSTEMNLFLDPFKMDNLTNPWVYLGIGAVAAGTVLDYISAHNAGLPATPRITPYSNFLYSFNYEVWQPIGSGAPEEMFYRGFLQNELYDLVPSPFFSIPLATAAFAFSHAPGPGRITAAVAGAYLGFLAHKYDGKLGPGITVHFWGVVLLGMETALLSHEAQHTTPPATMYVQINY